MPTLDESILERVAVQLRAAPSYAEVGTKASILAAAASSYGSRPNDEEVTQPTGFDPEAAALFEAVVESAFLVANADGDFDDTERRAFQHVVITACNGRVAEAQVSALLADLGDQLSEDGLEKRVKMVARTVRRPDHAQEVLRVASLLAQVSGGVSDVERNVLQQLAREFGVDGALENALKEADRVLGS